ncbi:MAG: molecular chaperone TorD family protein [Candidatus Nezhaarchaeota archaeon]|nr:molecular chaperone TorD family protein [Candidatus Nezhaarchaeota archaeon]
MSLFEDDVISVLRGRGAVYAFLGRIYEREVDEGLLRELVNRKALFLKFEAMDGVDASIKEGFRELHDYLAGVSEDRTSEVLLELAMDYASLFLGVRYAYSRRGIAHPSESVYMTGYMCQEVLDQISGIYLEAGLTKNSNFREPEDHISLEMHFMAHMCRASEEALKRGDLEVLDKHVKVQERFLREHLLKWALRLAGDIIENAETPFYRAVGKITKGLLSSEEEAINQLMEVLKNMRGAQK